MWRTLFQLPRRAIGFLSRGEGTLASLSKQVARLGDLLRDSRKRGDASRDELRKLRRELADLRREVHDRLLQNTMTVTRAARALEQGAGGHAAAGNGDVRLSSRPIALEPGESREHAWEPVVGSEAPDPEGREWLTLAACPACGHPHFTVVSRWNKLILLEKAPDATSARYDYALCHTCGMLFASRRPSGERYRFLLQHFEEVTAKRGGEAVTNLVLNPRPLSDADREQLRRLAARGVFISDHSGLSRRDYLAPLLRDRFENSLHTDVIGALLAPRGARVLEVRSRAGSILDGLRNAWGAEVYAMPIWESQQFLLREVYGIDTSATIDFDHFAIPFEGVFDLVICNHMITHAVRVSEFLAAIRAKLKPGGHLYLHNEPDDAEFLKGNQSMLATLNPLHLQAFDQASLVRALTANGFETRFVKHQKNETLFLLARVADTVPVTMSGKECQLRVAAYRQAYDRAVLRVDDGTRARLAGEWPDVVRHAVASGAAEFDERGQLRIVAP
jgi:SAM-dependent methyltransferase